MSQDAAPPPQPSFEDEDALVFRRPTARSWLVSAAAHGGVFLAIGVVGAWLGVRAGVLPRITMVEFTAPRRTPPPPRALPPAPPTPAPPQAQRQAARAPSSPAQRSAHNSRGANAPRVLATRGTGGGGSGGDSMAVGDNTDFRGGLVGNGGEAPPAPPPPAPPAPEAPPAPPAPRSEPVEVREADLAQRAVLQCDDAALAALYPQDALDSDVQVPVLPVEFLLDPDGSIVRTTARQNPGFGIAAAMERGARAHCRVTQPARNRRGEAVRSRIVWRLRFQFE